MIIGGIWVGLGLGDVSADGEIGRIKDFMRGKFKSYAGDLHRGSGDTTVGGVLRHYVGGSPEQDLNNVYDDQMAAVVMEMQRRYQADGKLTSGKYIPGVLNLETRYVMGYLKRPVVVRPPIFTVEGHLSDMWHGPAASIGSTLEGQGVALWRPVGYDCGALPFNDRSGVDELVRLVNQTVFDDGRPFPVGTPWRIVGFSQGAEIASQFMEQEVLAANGRCHHRLDSFERGEGIGNPRREYGKMCPWNDNPPPVDTGGILPHQFVTTGTVLQDRWQENANNRDMFSCNGRDAASQDKTAIARIICENSWIGGPTAIFARVLALFGNPIGGGFAAIKAAFDAIMFLASNPNPHYTTIAEPGDYDWMRGVAA